MREEEPKFSAFLQHRKIHSYHIMQLATILFFVTKRHQSFIYACAWGGRIYRKDEERKRHGQRELTGF
jgi:hypothetical protein